MTWQEPDVWGAASHRSMIANLTGPLAAGAVDTAVSIDPAGLVEISWSTREPLLVAALREPLGTETCRIRATLDPGGAATPLPALIFAPYTEAGAFLPLHRPIVDSGTRLAAPFTIALALDVVAPDGTVTTIPQNDLAARVELRVIEGILGRLIFLLGTEKAVLRRQGRELAAMRLLSHAHGEALDRHGADLGVPRFQDQLVYDAVAGEIKTDIRVDTAGQPISEPDEEYRRRLALYGPRRVPSRANLLSLLNGPGEAGDPNLGPLGKMGLSERFRVLEADNEFAVAIHLVASGPGTVRDNFLAYARSALMILPANNPAENTTHAARYLSQARKAQINALRASLRQNFNFPANAAITLGLAVTLDRAGRFSRALGLPAPWDVLRAQDSAGGSRYELGLGVDITRLTPAQLDEMRDNLLDVNRTPAEDAEIEELLRQAATTPPPNAAADPEGRWIWEACGLRTVHRLTNTRFYLSHLPAFGLAITGPDVVAVGAAADFQAQYHAPGDPGGNAVLVGGLTTALAEWTAGGGEPWTVLSDADGEARWAQAQSSPATDVALGVFRDAGLPAVPSPAQTVVRLDRLPPELLDTLVLPPTFSQRIITNAAGAADELRQLADTFRRHGLSSVLPLVTGPNEVSLVVGVIGLPGAGLNLAERRTSGFRWYAIPIQGPEGQVRTIGSRTQFLPAGAGLTALVALGYARRGQTDPYEYRIELPDDARLSLLQYEFLMNLLDASYPLGVEVNTFDLRQRHVDLDGDGVAEALPPTLSRTYRQFRRRRYLGEAGGAVEPETGS